MKKSPVSVVYLKDAHKKIGSFFCFTVQNVIADYYLLVNVEYQSVRVRERERLLRCCCCCWLTWYRFISITRSRLTEKSVQYRFQSSSSPTSLKPNSFDARCTAHRRDCRGYDAYAYPHSLSTVAVLYPPLLSAKRGYILS